MDSIPRLFTNKCKDCGEWCFGERCRSCWKKKPRKLKRKSKERSPEIKPITKIIKKHNWVKVEIKEKMTSAPRPYYFCDSCGMVKYHTKIKGQWLCEVCGRANKPKRALIEQSRAEELKLIGK